MKRRNQFIPEYFIAACAIAVAAVIGFAVWAADNPTPWNNAPTGHCYGRGC